MNKLLLLLLFGLTLPAGIPPITLLPGQEVTIDIIVTFDEEEKEEKEKQPEENGPISGPMRRVIEIIREAKYLTGIQK